MLKLEKLETLEKCYSKIDITFQQHWTLESFREVQKKYF